MGRKKIEQDLRAAGLRKKHARKMAKAADKGRAGDRAARELVEQHSSALRDSVSAALSHAKPTSSTSSKKASAKKASAKKAPAKSAKKAPAKKAPAKSAKKAPAKKRASTRRASTSTTRKAPTKKAGSAKSAR